MKTILETAKHLVSCHCRRDRHITGAWLSPHSKEVRYIETTNAFSNHGIDMLWPCNYQAHDDIEYPSSVILASSNEMKMIQSGKLKLPKGWKKPLIQIYDGLDPRRVALRKELEQLNPVQLKRILNATGLINTSCVIRRGSGFHPMLLALGNVWSHDDADTAIAWLNKLGYTIYCTNKIKGKFYRGKTARQDLMDLVSEVLDIKQGDD